MNEGFWTKLKKLYNKEDGNLDNFDLEKPILEKVLKKIEEALNEIYKIDEPIGRGGAGVIIRIKDKRLNIYRALKTPRPKEEIRDLIDSFKSEIAYLNKIRHENIISIHYIGNIKIEDYPFQYPYFVMDYIKDAQDIKKRTLDILKDHEGSKDVKKITRWIAKNFYKIGQSIDFLHAHKIIHFDIKPSNILIDSSDKPLLTDLGFAREKTEEDVEIAVGFTLFYAHPTLKAEYHQMSSKNRVKKRISPRKFEYMWDVYAFGKSLLEILSLVDNKFSDTVVYDYTFVYLHLMACRMLDGRNLPNSEMEIIRQKQIQNNEGVSIYKETWLELDTTELKEIKYANFKEIIADFEKILMKEYFLDGIPELNDFYTKRIQSSQGIPAPFSKRVGDIISHPVFSRLSFVPQLGLLNYVYPTATHNRLEHSLGTFRNCCLYIQYLYNDPYNPLFKQLVNGDDIKCVLVASLIHDIAQYPLAHDLGEFVNDLKHENLTEKFLINSSKDKFGHTIKDIITNPDWGWGIKIEALKKILKEGSLQKTLKSKNLKTSLLSSLIDGPIDTDKLDYLIRDSQNCYLRYGELIDFDRLIRNLTVIIIKNVNGFTGNTELTLGTYEKGQSAAEALTFARYLLYQSLYWHHTARAIRVMLREALVPAIHQKVKGRYGTFSQELFAILGIKTNVKNVTVTNILDLISKWTDDEGKNLINSIKGRDYYKRILTIHSYPQHPDGKESILEEFRKVYNKSGFQERLQQKILERFISQLSHLNTPKVSLLLEENTNKVTEILNTPKKILCDCPKPIIGSTQQLHFIPEPQRLQKNYYVRARTGERVSEVWNQVYYKLMNISSKGRVFCHPEIRDSLMAALSPNIIQSCVDEVITEFN